MTATEVEPLYDYLPIGDPTLGEFIYLLTIMPLWEFAMGPGRFLLEAACYRLSQPDSVYEAPLQIGAALKARLQRLRRWWRR